MRLLLALLGIALVAGVAACGGSDRAAPAAATTPVRKVITSKPDRDLDGDENDDDEKVLGYGYPASAADRRAIAALVTSYFAAAAASDGSKACSLMVPFSAEAIVDEYGRQPRWRGRNCATVVSKLFAHQHRRLAGEHRTLVLYKVRVEGSRSLTALYFSSLREVRQVTARRTPAGWRLLTLLAGPLE